MLVICCLWPELRLTQHIRNSGHEGQDTVAVINGIEVIVSWNFKHIVNFEKIQKFNAVNIEMGYKPILIYSPREVTTYGRESR